MLLQRFVVIVLLLSAVITSAAQAGGSGAKSASPSSDKPTSSSSTQKTNSNTETFKVTSPVHILHEEFGSDFTKEPYKSGIINYKSTAAGEIDVDAVFKPLVL